MNGILRKRMQRNIVSAEESKRFVLKGLAQLVTPEAASIHPTFVAVVTETLELLLHCCTQLQDSKEVAGKHAARSTTSISSLTIWLSSTTESTGCSFVNSGSKLDVSTADTCSKE
jgi:predicted  nucleic acid-binding Zn ribbon protein